MYESISVHFILCFCAFESIDSDVRVYKCAFIVCFCTFESIDPDVRVYKCALHLRCPLYNNVRSRSNRIVCLSLGVAKLSFAFDGTRKRFQLFFSVWGRQTEKNSLETLDMLA